MEIDRKAARSHGRLGEMAAASYLRKKGYDIVGANYRTRFGEIDIIAKNKNYIVFVEVKTRAENSMFLPREAVDGKKQAKIIKAAMVYLASSGDKLQPRFDVIEIITKNKPEFDVKSLNLIENAFTL